MTVNDLLKSIKSLKACNAKITSIKTTVTHDIVWDEAVENGYDYGFWQDTEKKKISLNCYQTWVVTGIFFFKARTLSDENHKKYQDRSFFFARLKRPQIKFTVVGILSHLIPNLNNFLKFI